MATCGPATTAQLLLTSNVGVPCLLKPPRGTAKPSTSSPSSASRLYGRTKRPGLGLLPLLLPLLLLLPLSPGPP